MVQGLQTHWKNKCALSKTVWLEGVGPSVGMTYCIYIKANNDTLAKAEYLNHRPTTKNCKANPKLDKSVRTEGSPDVISQ